MNQDMIEWANFKSGKILDFQWLENFLGKKTPGCR
tara:strand:- start:4360 stop:4464 length:105 start_codon:yes stop_codon:yes gene_type:complete